jgi:hypothetical protein
MVPDVRKLALDDRGAGHYFFKGSFHLVFIIIPFPVITAHFNAAIDRYCPNGVILILP